MTREEFAAKISELVPTIEAGLEQWALPQCEPIANLDDGVRYALGLDVKEPTHRGKRLRPALAILTCEALGGQTSQALPFAIGVELMHNYFLVHDDIEDGDTMRHGRPSVWKQFGVANAINIGDYLYGRVVPVVLRSLELGADSTVVLRLLTLLAETFDHTARGQALDMNARSSLDLTVERYLATVTEKTGHYLAAPLIGGAILAGADNSLVDDIRAYGSLLGPMYQIVDDLIDLTENKGRGERGADIAEGKRSFMVAFALSRLDRSSRQELLAILDCPRDQTSPDEVARAIGLLEQCGAIACARQTVRDLAERALRLVQTMPHRLSQLLVGLTNFLETRTR